MGLNKKKVDVEVESVETVYEAYCRMDVYRLRHGKYEGGWSDTLRREMLERGHAVAALLFDPDLDKLVMLEQFRPGAYAAMNSPWWDDDTSPWLVETVAGIIDSGETPESVARREAVEEAGCEIQEIEYVAKWLATPGICSETVILYCGRVDASNVGGVHGLDHEGEDILVMAVDADEAIAWIDQGSISNATCLIALQWFKMNRDRLVKQWRKA